MRNEQREQGFTLVEILIALAIFGVVIAQAFAVFGAQHLTYTGTERSIEVQQDVRLVTDAVLSDIRMAGYMVPKQAGISSLDGGVNGPDMLCISDPTKIADAEAASATVRFGGARVQASVSGGNLSVNLEDADMDIDGDGDSDFIVGEGVIIVDGTNSLCAVVTSITGVSNDVVNFAPGAPNGVGFAVAAGSGRAVPAVVYRLVGSDLMRNNLRLSNQVEDLQVEFGIDGDSDGQIAAAEYRDGMQGNDPLDLLQVRLSVIARADREDDELLTGGRPAAANRNAGPNDGFRRRRVTATIIPRNLL